MQSYLGLSFPPFYFRCEFILGLTFWVQRKSKSTLLSVPSPNRRRTAAVGFASLFRSGEASRGGEADGSRPASTTATTTTLQPQPKTRLRPLQYLIAQSVFLFFFSFSLPHSQTLQSYTRFSPKLITSPSSSLTLSKFDQASTREKEGSTTNHQVATDEGGIYWPKSGRGGNFSLKDDIEIGWLVLISLISLLVY